MIIKGLKKQYSIAEKGDQFFLDYSDPDHPDHPQEYTVGELYWSPGEGGRAAIALREETETLDADAAQAILICLTSEEMQEALKLKDKDSRSRVCAEITEYASGLNYINLDPTIDVDTFLKRMMFDCEFDFPSLSDRFGIEQATLAIEKYFWGDHGAKILLDCIAESEDLSQTRWKRLPVFA